MTQNILSPSLWDLNRLSCSMFVPGATYYHLSINGEAGRQILYDYRSKNTLNSLHLLFVCAFVKHYVLMQKITEIFCGKINLPLDGFFTKKIASKFLLLTMLYFRYVIPLPLNYQDYSNSYLIIIVAIHKLERHI